MATAWELKKAEAEKRAQQNQLLTSSGGTVLQTVQHSMLTSAIQSGGATGQIVGGFAIGQFLGSLVELAGALTLGLLSFKKQKKTQAKREKVQQQHQQVRDEANAILDTIEQTGLTLVQEHGLNPITAEFEQALYSALFDEVGYKGNCNANVWLPGSKPGKDRPIWFTVTGNGRRLVPVGLLAPPPNFQELWYVRCKNSRDNWIAAYRKLLIQQGRAQEAQDFESSLSKATWVTRAVFALLFTILAVTVLANMTRIK